MSCPLKRFPAACANEKPIDNEQVKAVNAKLAEMIAERERQDKAMNFVTEAEYETAHGKQPSGQDKKK